MEKILFISRSTPCRTNWAFSLGTIGFCALLLGWIAYRVPQTFLINAITLAFCCGCLILAYVSAARKFVLTTTHLIIKRYAGDSVIPLQNIRSLRIVDKKQYLKIYSWHGPFGRYPTKHKSIIAYNVRWNNWALLVTDRGKFLISPNDMQLIDAVVRQIENVKGEDARAETLLPKSKMWHIPVAATVVLAPLLFVYLCYKEPGFAADSNTFILKGIYGANIPFSEIAEADTVAWREMPAIAMRANGISLNKVHRGWFKTKEGKKVRLNINRGGSLVIRVREKDGAEHYINRKDDAETRRIFNELQKKIE